MILMATYNGARFLHEQLQSLSQQTHKNWSLFVSDDKSTDATRDILNEFASNNPDHSVTVINGPGQGAIANFMSLVKRARGDAPYFAFADQDDVWLPQRLQRSLAQMTHRGDQPELYGARTIIVDTKLMRRGLSPLFQRPPQFQNAIVQSLAGGNTMTFNAAACELLCEAGTDLDIVAHDWWLYKMVTGAGGRAIYDPEPALLYRQHDRNEIGSNGSVRAKLVRAKAVWGNRFVRWNDRDIKALERCENLLTRENRRTLQLFKEIRAAKGHKAAGLLRKSQIYRQTTGGDLSLFAAAFMGKL